MMSKKYNIDVVVMGSDWEGNENFECLKDICEVKYLPRTEGISTTKIKQDLGLSAIATPTADAPSATTLSVFQNRQLLAKLIKK